MGKNKKKQSHARKAHKRNAAAKQNTGNANGAPENGAATKNATVKPTEAGKDSKPLPNGANGAKRLDRAKQRAIVTRLLAQADQQGLQVGDKRFVISAKWWERWSEFVGLNADKTSAGETAMENPAPSRINNLPLLLVGADTPLDELMGGPLRAQLKENYHYRLLPQEVWDALVCWYGGGPTIARFVVQVGDPKLGNTFNRVEVYPEQTGEEESPEATESSGATGMSKGNTPAKKELVNGTKTAVPLANGTASKQAVQRKPSAVSSVIPKFCGACRKTTGSLKRCGNCQLIWYCGASCQMSHWKYHKSVCRSTLSTEEKEEQVLQDLGAERRGKMGLRNLGNTCFMNSALQCLSHTELLTRYFLSNEYKKDLNRDNPLGTGGNLAEEYDGLLKELWFGTAPSTAPGSLKRAISRFAPQFSGFQQHDAQELLAYIIDGLHEDLNRVKLKPYTEVKESDGSQEDAVVAKEAWDRHLLRNDSIFVDHVQGQFKSTVVCPVCGKVSITFDPFNCIQLELPQQQNRQFEVIFVPSDPESTMTRYLLEVPKKGSMLAMKRALSKLCGVAPSALLAADIYQSMTYRIIGDTEKVTRLRDDDRILMYQVENMPTTEPLQYGFLYHRVGSSLTGDPLLFTFNDSTTCAELLETCSELLSTHVSQMSKAKIPTNVLSQCVYLTDRDGAYLRREPVPLDESAKFADFATLQGDDMADELVFLSVAWSSAMLASASSPRPDTERIVNHDSMLGKAGGGRNRDGISLDDCFRNFVKPETLDQANLWYCSKCKEHRQARKTMEMWSLPDVLVLSLKRFEYRNEILRDKLDVYVDFPLTDLDMAPYCLEQERGEGHQSYELYGVCNHYGSMGFGHYTAFAKSWQDGDGERFPGWYSFDDSHVTPVMAGQVKTNAAYILFYKRKGLSPTGHVDSKL